MNADATSRRLRRIRAESKDAEQFSAAVRKAFGNDAQLLTTHVYGAAVMVQVTVELKPEEALEELFHFS